MVVLGIWPYTGVSRLLSLVGLLRILIGWGGSPQGYIGQSLGVILPQERSLSDDQETQACRGWSILGET